MRSDPELTLTEGELRGDFLTFGLKGDYKAAWIPGTMIQWFISVSCPSTACVESDGKAFTSEISTSFRVIGVKMSVST